MSKFPFLAFGRKAYNQSTAPDVIEDLTLTFKIV